MSLPPNNERWLVISDMGSEGECVMSFAESAEAIRYMTQSCGLPSVLAYRVEITTAKAPPLTVLSPPAGGGQ
jgi:hypothetical protein